MVFTLNIRRKKTAPLSIISGAFLILILGTGIVSCVAPKYTCQTHSCRQIPTGPGPEDMALDTVEGNTARLIISSADRRKQNQPGQIQALELNTDTLYNLTRQNEPDSLFFNPHGIDLWVDTQNNSFLYVISHDKAGEFVQIYTLKENQLHFKKALSDPLFRSLNGIAADGMGGFFVSNDHILRGNIVHCNQKGSCKVIKKGLSFANGLLVKQNKLYVATTLGNKVYEIDIDQNYTSRKVTRVKGGDNFSTHQGRLILAVHPSFFRFFLHVLSAKRRSPSKVYAITPDENHKNLLFSDKGNHISASATAIVYDNRLYISQVFEPFILEVHLTSKEAE